MTSTEFIRYLQPMRQWWWVIVGAALLAGISAFIYTRTQPVLYEAHATVMIGSPIQNPNPSGNELFLTETLAKTYADLANRGMVREAVSKALAIDLLPTYDVEKLPNSQILEITVIDADPKQAHVVAEEIIRQLILLSPAGREEADRRDFISKQLSKLEKSIASTEEEQERKAQELGSALSAREIRDIQDGIRALDEKLTTLQANYAALLSGTGTGAVNAIHVLEPSTEPSVPVESGALYAVLIAVVLGAGIAIAGAYAIEFLNDVVSDIGQAEKIGLVALGTVPLLLDTGEEPSRLVMLTDKYSTAAESYRVLRTNLQFASVDRKLQIIQITSPSMGEGKSLTAANLALAIAQIGQSVILVDADLHQPTQHRYFRLVNNVGVTSALLGNLDLVGKMLKPTAVGSLRVLPSGPLPPNPAELLGSKRMHDLLEVLRDLADVVIVDSPPVTVISDAVVLSTRTDGVLLVIRAGKTHQAMAKNAVDALKQVRANLIGFLLNGVNSQSHGYYYRYSSDYGVQRKHSTLTANQEGKPDVGTAAAAQNSEPA